MSRIAVARRLVGGWRRPSAQSISCLTSTPELEHNITLERPLMMPISSSPASSLSCDRRPSVPHRIRAFSSEASKKSSNPHIVELPPNLKFDPSARSSPFYDAERVVSERQRRKEERRRKAEERRKEREEGNAGSSAKAAVEETGGDAEKVNVGVIEGGSEVISHEEDEVIDYDEDEDSDDDEEEEERILYDLSTKPDIPRAIPLPQRLHVPVVDIKTAEEVGTFHLSAKTFGNDPVRVDILQRVVVWQRNKKRGRRNAGARTKTISEVSGSGRKVRPQKGGGQARAGHSRPAHWRGGAKAHGPKGRVQDYTTKLNKKVRKMGVRHVLSQKLKEGNLVVTSDLAVPSHKTRELVAMLSRFGVGGRSGKSALIIDDADPGDAEDEASVYGGMDVNFKVASGNIPKVKVQNAMACMPYSVLKHEKLFLSLAAVRSLEERLER